MIARLIDATVEPLWSNITLDIAAGEMIAVLGPNGSGKSTLLNCLAGIRRLQSGRVEVNGRLGLIPQQRMFDRDLPLRAGDLVSLALGHGVLRNRRVNRDAVDELLASVGAGHLADARVGALSGGQQQLVRQAQALAKNPEILLADEPFLSLDVARQRETVERFRALDAAVLMVTHSIDPVVDVVDRILYIGPQGHVLGPVEDVLDSSVLSDLYGAPVDVVTVRGKTVIV
ncbi:metal ABC transporter ATP-binding protein [Corynebacterium timonense]|uniref:Zinc/manganese transport system ATP-binding protein n=1 Tax=Corynebacterium timonense TaxID=441500 RepID=A0A1H1L7N7_9CORY|nr:metal ABC transporter ATP-binding protein [Corynebacterium timonense]SDR70506.1 zinc/manganese transport system ATP-binding protein [Corynebacterium timonense]